MAGPGGAYPGEDAWGEWDTCRVALLRCGSSLFSTVRIPADLVYAAAGTIDAENWLCWLVPPGTIRRWIDHPFGLCLSGPVGVAVPPQARREGPGRFWLRPPVRRFTDPSLLRRVLWRYQPAPSPHDVALPGILRRLAERQ
ncbi:hypothetical protein ACF053_27755 [Streptomyces kanasensis]|uniref:hypothetical protein n=1 Tax=Streptomyces kanasensis TaxID=936756 RepID=UPI0036F7BAB9